MVPSKVTRLPQNFAHHQGLTLPAALPCKTPGSIQYLFCSEVCAPTYSHAKHPWYWSGLYIYIFFFLDDA